MMAFFAPLEMRSKKRFERIETEKFAFSYDVQYNAYKWKVNGYTEGGERVGYRKN